jgi:hypothetical protein
MTDYDTMYSMLSKAIDAMDYGPCNPKLDKEKNSHEDILILHENGNEVWYYFDNKTHAISSVRVYGK